MMRRGHTDSQHESQRKTVDVPAAVAPGGSANLSSDSAQGRTSGQPRQTGPVPRRAVQIVLAMVCLTLVIATFFSSYASALGKPVPHHVPVAVTAPPGVVSKLSASPLLNVRPVPDLASARRLVEERTVYGALALPRTGPSTLLVANGGGHAVAAFLMEFGQHVARARGTPLLTVDVAPTSPNDPTGIVEFYCVAFLGIGAAVGASVLGRMLGPVRSLSDVVMRLGLVVLYAGFLSAVVAFFADVVFGALVGHFGLLFLTLWLFVAAVCLAVTGFAARTSLLASGVLILVFVLLGNPSSGAAVPRPLLNGFFSALNPVLPQGATLSALRGIQYFGNNGIAPALLCLLIWAAAGVALLFSAGLGWPHRRIGTVS